MTVAGAGPSRPATSDAQAGDGGADAAVRAAPGARPMRRRPVHLVSTVVGVVGVLVVASLVWLTGVVNSHTQSHLLHVQTDAAGLVIGEVVPTIVSPLNTAVAVAEQSGGNAAAVTTYVRGVVGTKPGRLFAALSVWQLSAGGPKLVVHLGRHTRLSTFAPSLSSIFASVRAPETLTVVNLVGRTPPRLGFAVESVGSTPRYAVFAASDLSPHHRAVVPSSSAFHDLEFALYLGNGRIGRSLIESTTPAPGHGPTASVRVPFGTSSLDLVASAHNPLGGELLPALPWIIGGAGALLVAAGVAMAEWLMRRRRTAEHLARENLRLYAEQRSISQTLQNALLPKRLPAVAGVALAARYVPGEASADVGGDWYDVIRCDDRSFIFAIGDVSGRGVPAANTMASLHYAIRAYAAQGDDAETILHKLTTLLDVVRDGHFATVLLGHVDVPDHRMTLVNAGHLPPLVISGDDAQFVEALPGTPIGVAQTVRYVPLTVQIPRGASVLAYTDGLVERRGEYLDTGMERLREAAVAEAAVAEAAVAEAAAPEGLLDRVVSMLSAEAGADDVALLAIRWAE